MILILDEGFQMFSFVVVSKLKKKIRYLVVYLLRLGP